MVKPQPTEETSTVTSKSQTKNTLKQNIQVTNYLTHMQTNQSYTSLEMYPQVDFNFSTVLMLMWLSQFANFSTLFQSLRQLLKIQDLIDNTYLL